MSKEERQEFVSVAVNEIYNDDSEELEGWQLSDDGGEFDEMVYYISEGYAEVDVESDADDRKNLYNELGYDVHILYS